MRYLVFPGLLIACLAGCSASKGLLNEPPRPTSVQNSVDVRVHNVIPKGQVTFTIDDVEIFGFVEPSHFDFVLDSGGYMFGYKTGGKDCRAEVMLHSGIAYVFNLAPDCVIEMQ
jgi:hypothetical protein